MGQKTAIRQSSVQNVEINCQQRSYVLDAVQKMPQPANFAEIVEGCWNYLTKNGNCVRYIDAVGEVHNYQKPISQTELAQITELQGFCTNAVMEIAWAFEGKE